MVSCKFDWETVPEGIAIKGLSESPGARQRYTSLGVTRNASGESD
ncbi:hypothetical protein EV286_103190 [Rhizobium sp. BK251]|nr:hypothetical protein EV286_103190 [Rhizobium sp. BK251]